MRHNSLGYWRRMALALVALLVIGVPGLTAISALAGRLTDTTAGLPRSQPTAPLNPGGTNLVISQVYGGGGNTGAPYQNDFIEVFNPTAAPIVMTGWSVQYASATGITWSTTPLNGTIPAGGYFLVKEAGGAIGAILPTADATGTINMSGTAGKVALVSSTTALAGACPTGASIVDIVGFGATANCFEGTGPTGAPSNTTAAIRNGAGCTDTDNNSLETV